MTRIASVKRDSGEGKVLLEVESMRMKAKNAIIEAIILIDAQNTTAEVTWDSIRRFVND